MSEILTDIGNNKCEICNQPARRAIMQEDDDDDDDYSEGKIRFTCEDHYMKLHERILHESGAGAQNNK